MIADVLFIYYHSIDRDSPNRAIQDMPNCTGSQPVHFGHLIWNASENGAREKEQWEEREREGGKEMERLTVACQGLRGSTVLRE